MPISFLVKGMARQEEIRVSPVIPSLISSGLAIPVTRKEMGMKFDGAFPEQMARQTGVAIRGAVCIDLNMVIDPKDLQAKPDYDKFMHMIAEQSNKCPEHNEREINKLLNELRAGQCDNVEMLLDEHEREQRGERFSSDTL
jgi:hypothetical protein